MTKKDLLAFVLLTSVTLGTDANARTRQVHSARLKATATDLIYDVPVIEQTKNNDCWAAAAAMLISWKSNIEVSELSVATTAGPQYLSAFQSDSGLFPQNVGDFASQLHLVAEVPQNFGEQGYRDLLTRFGPLWAGTMLAGDQGTYKHVRIISGIDDAGQLHIIDPNGPRIYVESVSDFATELEAIAKQDLKAGADLTPQIIHQP